MKFLAVPSLEKLSAVLSSVDLGDRLVSCKVEAYSCKQAGDDKKFSKALERQISEEYFPSQPPALHGQHSSASSATSISSTAASLSSTNASSSSSSSSSVPQIHFSPISSPAVPSPITPLGPIGESSTRKLLISLIQTMNAALSDYDFSLLRAEQFTREAAPQKVKDSINNLFLSSLDHLNSNGIRDEFWKSINDCIDCDKSEIYSFAPDPDSDLSANKLCAEAQNKLSIKTANTPAASPSPSKTGKHSGFKRAMDRSKNASDQNENRMDDGSKADNFIRRNSMQSSKRIAFATESNAMMESGIDEDSQSKAAILSDSLASSTDDDTENQDENPEDEEETHSKRRRRNRTHRRRSSKSAGDADDEDEHENENIESDDGESVGSSMTDGYIFDPDSDEQLAQIRQAAALQATEVRVSGSPLNMPLRAPQSGAVFSSLRLPAINTLDGTPKLTPFFPFTTSALSPYIAAVSFQASDASKQQTVIPSLTLQPALNTKPGQQLNSPQLQAYQRTESTADDMNMNTASPANASMDAKASFNNPPGRSILSQRG